MNFWNVILSDPARNAAVSISAIFAAATFIVSQVSANRSRRNTEVQFWIKCLIQNLMQKLEKEDISFDDIIAKARTDAISYSSYKIKANELSPEYVRRSLIDLIGAGVIKQTGKDHYRINSPSFMLEDISNLQRQATDVFLAHSDKTKNDFLNASNIMNDIASQMAEVTIDSNKVEKFEKSIRENILKIIFEEPYSYNHAQLALKLGDMLGTPTSDVRVRIAEMYAKKEIVKDKNGMYAVSAEADVRQSIIDVDAMTTGFVTSPSSSSKRRRIK